VVIQMVKYTNHSKFLRIILSIIFFFDSFTVHGFRYISVFGSPNSLSINDVECFIVHSETTMKGYFTSNNQIINQIQHNIQWSQLSNLMSIPTDCPQRDERKGWLGDAALTINEALYNFDLIKFYLNFLNLIIDIQLNDGSIPDTVPFTSGSYPADPNWGTALPTITWQLYRHYQDIEILRNYYSNIRKYIESVRFEYNKTGLIKLNYHYADWIPPPPQSMTNVHLISSFAFLHDIFILINMSKILDLKDDIEIYSKFYQELAEEFHRVFFISTLNYYADGMQAAQILALALPNVVPNNVRENVLQYLVNDIHEKGNHITTGIISTAQLFPLLSDNGYHDLAIELISSITYPSYGYMFNNPYENATTLWELWDAPLEGPEMNSRNHIMFGSIGAWFYSHLAGINIQSDFFIIRPKMISEQNKYLLDKIDCQLSTLYGLVHISYTRNENETFANSILLRITIPLNIKAKIIFEPLFLHARCVMLTEGDNVIWSDFQNNENQVIHDVKTELMTVEIGSGQYVYQVFWI
jgi:alpha-L-rhamnosidase